MEVNQPDLATTAVKRNLFSTDDSTEKVRHKKVFLAADKLFFREGLSNEY